MRIEQEDRALGAVACGHNGGGPFVIMMANQQSKKSIVFYLSKDEVRAMHEFLHNALRADEQRPAS